jgi:broad specificity phosphatase PhoE
LTRLLLCRHAEVGNVEEANELAAALASVHLEAVYTSPLERALTTSRVVAARHRLVPVEVADLREIDFGEVEGVRFDQLPAELRAGLLNRPLTVRFPGGETFAELRERVCRALDAIVARHSDETVAIVTHAGSIRAALATWLGIAGEQIFRIDQRTASINIVDWLEGMPVVRLVNGTRP